MMRAALYSPGVVMCGTWGKGGREARGGGREKGDERRETRGERREAGRWEKGDKPFNYSRLAAQSVQFAPPHARARTHARTHARTPPCGGRGRKRSVRVVVVEPTKPTKIDRPRFLLFVRPLFFSRLRTKSVPSSRFVPKSTDTLLWNAYQDSRPAIHERRPKSISLAHLRVCITV